MSPTPPWSRALADALRRIDATYAAEDRGYTPWTEREDAQRDLERIARDLRERDPRLFPLAFPRLSHALACDGAAWSPGDYYTDLERDAQELVVHSGTLPDAATLSAQDQLARGLELADRALVQAALAAGADPNAPTLLGYPSLSAALLFQTDEGIALDLLAHGAAPPPAPAQHDLLVAAAHKGWQLVVRALLAAGADPDAPAGNGLAPLVAACLWPGHPPIVAALLAAGADPRATCAVGLRTAVTALHEAAECGSPGCVELLLAADADPTARDSHGHTPHDRALTNGHHTLATMLNPHP